MSVDEAVVLMFCSVISLLCWGAWLYEAAACARLGARSRWGLYVFPLVCAAALFAVLRSFASFDVRDSPLYLGFYMVMGAAWVGLSARLPLPLFGLSPRDDVIERGNPAAAQAIGGALLGITFCFAGGNIGDGPGWWVVVFSAALSTATFFILWALLDKFTRLADTVTIERDQASGIRLAGYFIGSGLILGRAVAGNWVNSHETLVDFVRLGWPVTIVWLAAVLLERTFRPTADRPAPSTLTHGIAPLGAYVALALFFVAQAGWWS